MADKFYPLQTDYIEQLNAMDASFTDASLQAWEAEASRLTADSYATQLEDVFVNIYTSDGDGTYTATPSIEYSALHYDAKATVSSSSAGTSETNAGNSATNSQLSEWEAEASRLTAASYATQAENVLVQTFTSDGDGTYTAVNTLVYSALHYATKSAADVVLTNADVVLTNQDTIDTAADAAQTALDKIATNADVVLTNADVVTCGGLVAGVNLPTVTTGDAGKYLEVNVSETGYDLIVPVTGISTLDALTDTTITTNSAGELLKWTGTAWVNNTLAEAGIQPLATVLTNTTASFTTALSGNIVTNNGKISFDSTSSTRLANTSGTNSGDNATNSQYSGLITNVSTNLSIGTRNTNTTDINSSDGTNATIPAATTSLSGVLTGADKAKLDGITGSNTGDQTITLTGDATGSGTASITVVVADDSHNHITSNVDGLDTALTAKLAHTNGTTTGLYETVIAVPALSIDFSAGNIHTKTISATSTFTFTGLVSGKSSSTTFILTTAGTETITWTGVTWDSGTAPTNAAAGTMKLVLYSTDGINVSGSIIKEL